MKKIFLFVTCAFLLSCSNKAEEEKAEIERKKLEAQVTLLQVENDSLKDQLEMLNSSKQELFPEAFDSITNPEELLTKSLNNKPELIPEEGVLGGTMHFINFEILNERYILAEYEDGHIQGKALYSYSLSEKGKPEFKFISKVEE